MQNISFGRVLKINAPGYIADGIIEKAQRKEISPLNKKAGRLLGSCRGAHAYSFGENESYIFTGKDGQKFWQSHCKAWDKMDYAHEYYHGDVDYINPMVEEAWENHENTVKEIINSADKVHELDVQYGDNTGYKQVNIKSINVIA